MTEQRTRPDRACPSRRPQDKPRRPGERAGEYSAALGALARFTLDHKAVVIGAWIVLAAALALLFPQLETVVKQQSVDMIPRDVASLRALDKMSAAFGERGSKTMIVVAMEDPAGLTRSARPKRSAVTAKRGTCRWASLAH